MEIAGSARDCGLTLCALAMPAQAVTVSKGVLIFNQADGVTGSITPGDTPGYPVTLSASGSYRLPGYLAPSRNSDGIVVNASDVTVDFFGFRMAGSGVALNCAPSTSER